MIRSGYKPTITEVSNHLPILVHKKNMDTENSLEIRLHYITEESMIESSIRMIPIKDIISLQPTIIKEKVDEMVGRDSIDKSISTYKVNGHYILIDGNHRANALLLQGKSYIKSKVYDIDDDNSELANELLNEITDDNYDIVRFK